MVQCATAQSGAPAPLHSSLRIPRFDTSSSSPCHQGSPTHHRAPTQPSTAIACSLGFFKNQIHQIQISAAMPNPFYRNRGIHQQSVTLSNWGTIGLLPINWRTHSFFFFAWPFVAPSGICLWAAACAITAPCCLPPCDHAAPTTGFSLSLFLSSFFLLLCIPLPPASFIVLP